MSTCSSDSAFSSSDEDDGRPIVIPEFRKVTYKAPMPDLSGFYAKQGLNDEPLTARQLEDRVGWCNEIYQQLSLHLQSLTETLQSEWTAKEDLLEQLLEKETGLNWKMP